MRRPRAEHHSHPRHRPRAEHHSHPRHRPHAEHHSRPLHRPRPTHRATPINSNASRQEPLVSHTIPVKQCGAAHQEWCAARSRPSRKSRSSLKSYQHRHRRDSSCRWISRNSRSRNVSPASARSASTTTQAGEATPARPDLWHQPPLVIEGVARAVDPSTTRRHRAGGRQVVPGITVAQPPGGHRAAIG